MKGGSRHGNCRKQQGRDQPGDRADRVTVAFLVGTAALEQGKQVVMFLTKEAVRLGLPGYAEAVESAGAPPVSRLFAQFAEKGGELLVCPICFNARKLDEASLVDNARLAGATPLWEWIGEGATVFSLLTVATRPRRRSSRRRRRSLRSSG